MPMIRLPRPLVAAAVVSLVALIATACSGSAPVTGPANATDGSAEQQLGQGQGGWQGNRVPGTFGLIAQISGRTLQVQSTDSQTAVSYTATTRFSQTVATTKAAVRPGDCVVVRSESTRASASPTHSSATAPIPPAAVTAASVEVTAAASGQCSPAAGAFGGSGGFRGGGADGQPTGTPTTFTQGSGGQTGQPGQGGSPTRRLFGGEMTFGKVTAVTSSGFVVSAVSLTGRANQSGTPSAGSTSSGTPTATTRSVTVTVTGSTTYTTTKAATAKALAVGRCVAARGATDDTGAVTATTIAISPATNGQCAVRGF